MIQVLVDHNLEGKALILWGTLAAEGWLELLPIKLIMFADVDLPCCRVSQSPRPKR